MSAFYILSLKWTRGEDCITWWRPNSNGYTLLLEDAGRYSEEEVRGNPDYFDNRESTMAVPCAVVEKFMNRVVLKARSDAMLTEALGKTARLLGAVVDDDGECPECERSFGRPGPQRIAVDPNTEVRS